MEDYVIAPLTEIADVCSDKTKSKSCSSSSDSDDDKGSHSHSHSHSHAHHIDLKSKVYRLFGREKPLHQVLGAGKPTDIFLWRDKKLSGSVLGGVTAFWFLFEMLQYHLITLVCHLMILSLSVLFLWSNASNFINNAPPIISQVVIPEKCLIEAASCLTVEINRTLDVVRKIATGKDLKTFLGAVVGLWFMAVLGSCFNFLTLTYIAYLLICTLPVLYEKYEDKVDEYAEKALIEIKKQYAELEKKVMSNVSKEKKKKKKKN